MLKKKEEVRRSQRIERFYFQKNQSIFDFKQEIQEKREEYNGKLMMHKMEKNERAMLLRDQKLKA